MYGDHRRYWPSALMPTGGSGAPLPAPALSMQIGIRISGELKQRLDQATCRELNPCAPTLTQLVQRGIRLALEELADKPAIEKTRRAARRASSQ